LLGIFLGAIDLTKLNDINTLYSPPSGSPRMEEKGSENSSPNSATHLLSQDEANHQSLAFGRAAFAFQNRLANIRNKHDSKQAPDGSPIQTSTANEGDTEKDAQAEAQDARRQKPIRVLRAVQGLLTAILSVLIAIFQAKVYIRYLHTKNVPDAWPTHPSLLPTLMLLSIAIIAFVFDILLIFAYVTPDKGFAGKAFQLANKMHYVLTTTKTVSYTLVGIVCKAGFEQGNSSGTNSDLWSWTCACAAKGDQQPSGLIMAKSNCDTQVRGQLEAY
jgi:hypothetical protein